MDIVYCEKCHQKKRIKSISNVHRDLTEIFGDVSISNNCISYCGPGKKKHIISVDDIIYEDDDYDNLILQLKEEYDN